MSDLIESIKETVKCDDTIFFLVDEWHRGNKRMESGTILYKTDRYVSVVYLSGYRSRNDDIPYNDIYGRLDLTKPWVSIPGWSGHIHLLQPIQDESN